MLDRDTAVLYKYEKKELVKNFDWFNSLKHRAVAPTAYTEKGLYMFATILKSPHAVNTTLAIIDTFTMTRQLARTMESLQTVEDGGEQQKSLLQKTGEILVKMKVQIDSIEPKQNRRVTNNNCNI